MQIQMRKLFLVFVLLVGSFLLSAEAPELKKALPTEWKYMTKLTVNEKKTLNAVFPTVYKETFTLLDKNYTVLYDMLLLESCDESFLKENSDIYIQTVGSDIFYWMVINFPAIKNPIAQVKLISLFKKDSILTPLCIIQTSGRLPTKFFHQYIVNTVQIIKGNTNAKGYIQFVNTTEVDMLEGYIKYNLCKDQIVGKVYGFYYLFKDEPKDIQLNGENVFNLIPRNWPKIRINASAFLWDEKDPLKYSLQNAFDGDPATSFVENTEDDLMKIEVSGQFNSIRIALINGYASILNMYLSNNRIKSIASDFTIDSNYPSITLTKKNVKYELRDKMLDYQIIDYKSNGVVFVSDVYKGSKFSDTCIAEVNFLHIDGWLFGDIDE